MRGPSQLGMGLPKRVIGSTMGAGLGKGSLLVRSASWIDFCCPAWAVVATSICGCGAALEVGGWVGGGGGEGRRERGEGTKSWGTLGGTVEGGGRGMPGGQCVVRCKGDVPERSVLVGESACSNRSTSTGKGWSTEHRNQLNHRHRQAHAHTHVLL